MPDEETFSTKIAWYGVVIAIAAFLIVTNYRFTKIQQETINIDEKLNGLAEYHFELITSLTSAHNKSVDYLQKTENELWDGINVLQQINADWWFKKHNLNLDKYLSQMNAIAANCSLRTINNNYVQHWTDDVISLQLNSSKGDIIVNYFSDGSIKCKKDFFDNQNISCQELCSEKWNKH